MKTAEQIKITPRVGSRRGLHTRTAVAPLAPRQSKEQASGKTAIHPFHVNVPESELTELRRRINATKWPERETVTDATQGVQLATIQALASYWATDYDWRKIEARMNAYLLMTTPRTNRPPLPPFTLETAKQKVRSGLSDVIIPPSLRDAHMRGFARYLATGEARVLGKRIEMPAIRADGTEFPLELAITRIPLDGRPSFTGCLRDITERKQSEVELRRIGEAISRIASRRIIARSKSRIPAPVRLEIHNQLTLLCLPAGQLSGTQSVSGIGDYRILNAGPSGRWHPHADKIDTGMKIKNPVRSNRLRAVPRLPSLK